MTQAMEIPPKTVYYTFDAIKGHLVERSGEDWHPENPEYDPGPPPPPRIPRPPEEALPNINSPAYIPPQMAIPTYQGHTPRNFSTSAYEASYRRVEAPRPERPTYYASRKSRTNVAEGDGHTLAHDGPDSQQPKSSRYRSRRRRGRGDYGKEA